MTEKQNQSSNLVDNNWQYTRCPNCQAVFRIDQNKLLVRKGEVRCGSCRLVFHAPSNIVYRDNQGRFSSLPAKQVADDHSPRETREEAHRAAVRAKMGLDPVPSSVSGSAGMYSNRANQFDSYSREPYQSAEVSLDSTLSARNTGASNTLESNRAESNEIRNKQNASLEAKRDINQPELIPPKFDPPAIGSSSQNHVISNKTTSDRPYTQKVEPQLGTDESLDSNSMLAHISESDIKNPTAPDTGYVPSRPHGATIGESAELHELDLKLERAEHLDSFADSTTKLVAPKFDQEFDELARSNDISLTSSISADTDRDNVVQSASSYNQKTPIQLTDDEESFDASIQTNPIDENSEIVELVIPKISSESMVNRQLENAEDSRSEPRISIESEKAPQISDYSDLNFEDAKDAVLQPDSDAVQAAREALIFEPLSEAEVHDEPQLEVIETNAVEELVGDDDPGEEPTAEIQLPEFDSSDNESRNYSATTTQTPPRFEPFIPSPPPSDSENKNSSEELIDQWNVKDDSLLDHNPFAAKFEAAEPSPAELTELKMDPRPAAINMSGVDEYIVDRPNPLVGVFWSLVSIGFVILLGLQVKYFLVERFAQHEAYRPYLQVFCKVARCELPPRRDAYRFTITQTRVDLHPQEPGALRITVRLLNQADFSQPYPELRLTLTDRVGRVVGRRKFDPDFYLQAGAANRLSPGELGYVVFDLASPHEKAVGFVVDVVRRSI